MNEIRQGGRALGKEEKERRRLIWGESLEDFYYLQTKRPLFSLIATVLLFPAWVGVMCLHAKLPLRVGVRYLSGC